MGCSSCEKKRQLLIEQARQRLEARARGETTGVVRVLTRGMKGDKKLPESKGPWSVCPGCANYKFYCTCVPKSKII